jgi:hypothetical protein
MHVNVNADKIEIDVTCEVKSSQPFRLLFIFESSVEGLEFLEMGEP